MGKRHEGLRNAAPEIGCAHPKTMGSPRARVIMGNRCAARNSRQPDSTEHTAPSRVLVADPPPCPPCGREQRRGTGHSGNALRSAIGLGSGCNKRHWPGGGGRWDRTERGGRCRPCRSGGLRGRRRGAGLSKPQRRAELRCRMRVMRPGPRAVLGEGKKKKRVCSANRNERSRGRSLLRGHGTFSTSKVGGWRLAVGGGWWRLAFGGCWGLSLIKKKLAS
mmetsp:Transcript_65444/g.108882  ORF Transcript_65444/g.108882 Transcript_65444/m.108882 type:complete len:220 (-) Transcript_65444:1613-2272(-)